MSKKKLKSKSSIRVVERRKPKTASIITHFFESVWAMGAGAAAAMVISTSTHRAERAALRP